eukprot:12319104-Ditylum_brightwellii.AAC.1
MQKLGSTVRTECGAERHMVDNIRLVKPCNISQWEHVLALFCAEYAEKDYDMTSLRRKFVTMHCKHPGTGNLNSLDNIYDAKIVWYEIKQKAEYTAEDDSADNEEYLGGDNRGGECCHKDGGGHSSR